MAEVIDYSKFLPTEPPEGMLKWMREKGFFEREFIVYKSAYHINELTGINEAMAECTCSACEHTFYMTKVPAAGCSCGYAPAPFGFYNEINGNMEAVISGDDTLCPYCGMQVTLYHVSKIPHTWINVNDYYPMSIHRIGNRLALLSWNVNRKLNKNGTTRICVNPWEAYVIEDRKIVRLTGYYKRLTSESLLGIWEQKKRYVDTYGSIPPYCIFPFTADVLNETTAENCKLDMYCVGNDSVYPVTYMYLWVKHKNVENLIMQGLQRIVNEKIHKLSGSYYNRVPHSIRDMKGINWKETKPDRMLGISKEDFRFLKKHKWKLDDLDFYKEAKEFGIKAEDVKLCDKHGYYSVRRLFDYKVNVMKALRYIEKQRSKYMEQRKATISELIDYWDMAEKLGDNLDDEAVRYPQNLISAHDAAVSRIEFKKSAELQEKFDNRYKELEKYIYSNGTLLIRPAMSQLELVAEGKILHHCVGGYAKRMANGETAIFFIRYAETPESSYFTLELDEKNLKVRQNRGLQNCSRTEEVKEFEAEWLEYIKKMDKESKNNDRKRNSKKRTAA